jgi:hypothetical protein
LLYVSQIASILVYTAPVAMPVESLGLAFKGQNVVMPVLIGQYHALPNRDPGARTVLKLQPLVNTTFFQLEQDGRRPPGFSERELMALAAAKAGEPIRQQYSRRTRR